VVTALAGLLALLVLSALQPILICVMMVLAVLPLPSVPRLFNNVNALPRIKFAALMAFVATLMPLVSPSLLAPQPIAALTALVFLLGLAALLFLAALLVVPCVVETARVAFQPARAPRLPAVLLTLFVAPMAPVLFLRPCVRLLTAASVLLLSTVLVLCNSVLPMLLLVPMLWLFRLASLVSPTANLITLLSSPSILSLQIAPLTLSSATTLWI
jgi:hypothetical protein